jgi:threonine aldolase
MFLYEQGSAAQIAGVSPHPLPNMVDGTIDIDSIRRSIRSDNIHFPTTQLIAMENTHYACGGRVLPENYLSEVKSFLSSKNQEIPIHLDGARLWNAAVAQEKTLSILAEHADSISLSLSKGLGAPAGSLLVGPKALINRARRARKVLGGGMRQVGILAAAGLKAVDDFNAGILSHDHRRAKALAKAIRELDAFQVEVDSVETNIVMIVIKRYNRDAWGDGSATTPATEVCNMLKEHGILALPFGSNIIRLVTHRDVNDDDLARTINAFQEISSILMEASVLKDSTAYNLEQLPAEITEVDALKQDALSLDRVVNEPSDSPTDAPAVDAELFTASSIQLSPPLRALTAVAAAVGGQSNESFYEEVVVHGMSVSDSGFVVLLRGLICDRILSIYVTPSDPMSDGLDRDIPETAEAVTLLQLLQGIDVETHLPRDTLSIKFACSDQGSQSADPRQRQMYLKRVMIDHATRTKTFAARLCGTYHNLDDDASVLSSLRSSYAGGVATDGSSAMNSTEQSQGSGSYLLQEDKEIIIPAHLYVDSTIDKEVEEKSSFEAIALALRHDAVIEVQSSLLHNQNISYSLNEVKAFFPKLLETQSSTSSSSSGKLPVGNAGFATTLTDKTNPIVELERRYRQLQEASRQQNSLKIDELKREINFYRRLTVDRDPASSSSLLFSSTGTTTQANASVLMSSDRPGAVADAELLAAYDIPPDSLAGASDI